MPFDKLGIKALLLCIMQRNDFNSLLFLDGGRFSKALTFLGSGLTLLDEEIIPIFGEVLN